MLETFQRRRQFTADAVSVRSPLKNTQIKVRRRIDILAQTFCTLSSEEEQGQRHGPEERQYHHWKAVDAAIKCRK